MLHKKIVITFLFLKLYIFEIRCVEIRNMIYMFVRNYVHVHTRCQTCTSPRVSEGSTFPLVHQMILHQHKKV